MKPDVIHCYHTAEELFCLLTSSKPSASPQGRVKHGCWVSTWQNRRCLVKITLEVHQHWMTAQIIKSSPLKSGILLLIQTPEQFHYSCLVSLKVQLMRARGGEAAEPDFYATFDTKRCPGRDESTRQQRVCWDILCLNGRFGFKWDPATSGAASSSTLEKPAHFQM